MITQQHGRYTLKVDASFDQEYGIAGIGIVMQHSIHPRRPGRVIDKIAEWSDDVLSGLAEKYAILRALELAKQRRYRCIIIRSDYNAMRKQLKQDIAAGTGHDRDVIHTHILKLIHHFDEVHIRYQPRRKNQEAHKLARKAVQTGRVVYESVVKNHERRMTHS